MKYSQSTIERYLICPRRFYFYVTSAPKLSIETPQLRVGTFIHSLIQEFFQRIDLISSENIEKLGRVMAEEYNLSSNPVLMSMWSNFIEYEKEKLYEPALVEQKVEDERFIGIIDFYSKDGVLIDWKTTSVDRISNEKLTIQSSVYYYLLSNVLNLTVKEVKFVFLQGNRYVEKVVEPDLSYLDEIVSELEFVAKGIIEGSIRLEDLEKPSKRIYCLNCEYRIRCFCHENNISWFML